MSICEIECEQLIISVFILSSEAMYQVKVVDEVITLGFQAAIDITDSHVLVQVVTDSANVQIFQQSGRRFVVVGENRLEWRLPIKDIVCLKVDERAYRIKLIVPRPTRPITFCFTKAVEVQRTTFVLITLGEMTQVRPEWLEDFVGRSMLRQLNEAYFITHNSMPQFFINKKMSRQRCVNENLYSYRMMEKVVREVKLDFSDNIAQMRTFLALGVDLPEKVVLDNYKQYLRTSVPYCWTQFRKHFPVADDNDNNNNQQELEKDVDICEAMDIDENL